MITAPDLPIQNNAAAHARAQGEEHTGVGILRHAGHTLGQGGHGGDNFVVNVTASGSTLTIIFDGSTVTFEVTQ